MAALPPVVLGGSLIIPSGLLARLTRKAPAVAADAAARKEIELVAMRTVMELERKMGFSPRDVSAHKCGYDIESLVPDALPAGQPSLRFIEVKGRAAGASTITVSRNEILTALNQPEQFILAVVEVDGSRTHTVYLKRSFVNPPDFTVESTTFNMAALFERAERIYEDNT